MSQNLLEYRKLGRRVGRKDLNVELIKLGKGVQFRGGIRRAEDLVESGHRRDVFLVDEFDNCGCIDKVTP